MSFNEAMSLIFPSLIAMLLYIRVVKRKIAIIELLCITTTITLITNCLSYAFLIYLWNKPDFDFSPTFTLKYSIMATVIATVLVTTFRFVELNVSVKMKVELENED